MTTVKCHSEQILFAAFQHDSETSWKLIRYMFFNIYIIFQQYYSIMDRHVAIAMMPEIWISQVENRLLCLIHINLLKTWNQLVSNKLGTDHLIFKVMSYFVCEGGGGWKGTWELTPNKSGMWELTAKYIYNVGRSWGNSPATSNIWEVENPYLHTAFILRHNVFNNLWSRLFI